MPSGPDLTFSFSKPEIFLKFKCDVHQWMFAWVSIFDHPYFAVSGKDGTLRSPMSRRANTRSRPPIARRAR